jgi:serine/threonine-protein kinase
VIGGYRLEKIIGTGGAGRVYAARDEALGRSVAIKLLHPQLARDAKNRERFQREARAMATVRSPHVAAVYSIGEERGMPYIVMEYFPGENLEQRLKSAGRLRVEEALVYARDCALALQAADGAGIVHRDVKPANIVVKDGRAVLTDFGLARPMDGSANMTVEGEIAGTAMFMSPDRITGQGDDRRADIYSLGATLYCLIAGRPPFESPSPMDVIAAHINEQPQPLNERAPGTSPKVAALVTRMMEKEPAARQQDYDQLIAEMTTLIDGGGEVDRGLVEEPTEVHSEEAPTPPRPSPTSAEQRLAQANDPFGANDAIDANDARARSACRPASWARSSRWASSTSATCSRWARRTRSSTCTRPTASPVSCASQTAT